MVIHNLSSTGSRDRFHVVAMQALKHFKEEEKKRIERDRIVVSESTDSSTGTTFCVLNRVE